MNIENSFYNLIYDYYGNYVRNTSAQSYLLCSLDNALLMLLTRLIIQNDKGKINSADVKIFPKQNDSFFKDSKIVDTLKLNFKTAKPSNFFLNLFNCDNASKLSVADIDEITSTCHFTPLELPFKYYVLDCEDGLNDSSSNKLLKTLEEPPGKVKIIILAKNNTSVLPTIKSRCHTITPPPLNKNQLSTVSSLLFGDNSTTEKAKSISMGNITTLFKAISGQLESIQQFVFDTLLNMKNSKMEVYFCAKALSLKEKTLDIINMLELVLSDVLLAHYGKEIKLNYEKEQIIKITKEYSVDTILRLKPIVDKMRQRLALFGNNTSIMDELLFSLLEVRQKCQSW